MNDIIIKYWGVRGSVPAPLTPAQVKQKQVELVKMVLQDKQEIDPERVAEYLETFPVSLYGTYGGNTTCIEVQAKDSPLIMIDSGSGAREMGNALLGRMFGGKHLNPLSEDQDTARDLHLFFTHYHWDHLQGFPFFGPAFIAMDDKRLNIHFYGKRDTRKTLSDVLIGQQEYPNFPVVWEDMPCEKEYHQLGRMLTPSIPLGAATVRYQQLTHPDSVFAYRVDVNGKSFVCATDTEHKDSPDPRLIAIAKDADILYYDGQYTPEEYVGAKGLCRFDWGHSTYEWAVQNALAAGVKTVVIGHHDPSRDDFGVELIGKRANEYRDQLLTQPENQGKKLDVVMAYEGLEQKL